MRSFCFLRISKSLFESPHLVTNRTQRARRARKLAKPALAEDELFEWSRAAGRTVVSRRMACMWIAQSKCFRAVNLRAGVGGRHPCGFHNPRFFDLAGFRLKTFRFLRISRKLRWLRLMQDRLSPGNVLQHLAALCFNGWMTSDLRCRRDE